MPSPPLYAEPVSSGDDDSTVWRKFCRALQQGGGTAPVNLSAPQLSDSTPDEGTSVSVSNGTWSGSPTSFTYQWFLDGNLQAETSNTFAIPSDAGGGAIYAIVTALNEAGSASQQSDTGAIQDVDPLAGIPYRLRFETTWDKVTLQPMWQDVARTIPVTSEGDPVATMGSADAELVPEQGDGEKRGVLLLAADGTPYIDLDGVDDWYSLPSFGGPVTYTLLINPRPWTGYWSPCDNSAANADHFGAMDAFTTAFQPGLAPASARRDGVDLVFPFSMAPLEEWAVWTVVTASPPASLRGLFQLAQTWFGPISVMAFFIYDGAPSNPDRNTVESFYETLKPAP